MITDEQKQSLLQEFPELDAHDVIVSKEVYAHFGLAFFKFSCLEMSMINALVMHGLGAKLQAGEFRNQHAWETTYDEFYAAKCKRTFGQLRNDLIGVPEFTPFADTLKELNASRNYFAHHFFREEVGFYSSEAGCWHLLAEIAQLRAKLTEVDDSMREPIENMCMRLGIPRPTTTALQAAESSILGSAQASMNAGKPRFG